MTDKQPMPADGGGRAKGAPDGVSGSPTGGEAHGRTPGGESGGGGYENPHTGKEPTSAGFMGHGGQTEIAYHGSGQAGGEGGTAPNAATGSASTGEKPTPADAPEAERKARATAAADRTFEVVEDGGSAAAGTNGKVAIDAPYEREQEQPGSG